MGIALKQLISFLFANLQSIAVQFSMVDVERWEEEERSQILQNSSGIP